MSLTIRQAEAAYDRMLSKAADDYFEADPTCPWCGASGQSEDGGECTECDRPLSEDEYFECPYCGKVMAEAFVCCGENHVTRYSLKDGCPQCFSTEIFRQHHEDAFSAPECTSWNCECGHQWSIE